MYQQTANNRTQIEHFFPGVSAEPREPLEDDFVQFTQGVLNCHDIYRYSRSLRGLLTLRAWGGVVRSDKRGSLRSQAAGASSSLS